MEVAVSYLVSKYEVRKTLKMIMKTSADYIHVDLMDGGFVPVRNFKMEEVLELLKDSSKLLDVHLMVFDPIIYIEDLAKIKPEYISFHLEATKDVVKTIEIIRKNNIKVGLVLKPETNVLELMPYLSLIDLVLIMSVEPGQGGQRFMMSAVDKLKELQKIRQDNNLNFKISMDGGINDESIQLVRDLDIVVSGSYVCKSDDYEQAIRNLRGE